MDTKKLIEEVLLDLGNNKPLTEVSAKIQIIVRLLGDDKLKKWYENEFVSGYKGQVLPDYRISQAADVKADYLVPQGTGLLTVTGQSIPVANLGMTEYERIMTVELYETIPAIVRYSQNAKNVVITLNPYEMLQIQKILRGAQIQNVYKTVSPSIFQAVIDNVQSRIIDLFMDLNDTVFKGELDFNSQSVKEEIHQVITNNFTAGIIQTGSGLIDAHCSDIAVSRSDNVLPKEVLSKLSELTTEIEKVANGNDEEHNEIAQDIVDIRTELAQLSPNKKDLKKSFRAIAGSAASISCKTAIEELVKKCLNLL